MYVKKLTIQKSTFYIQLEKRETETPETEIVEADMENEEVPVDDIEHGQIQRRSSKWGFIISLSLVALTIIYFIVGSFLAVGIKTNRDVSLAGNDSHY